MISCSTPLTAQFKSHGAERLESIFLWADLNIPKLLLALRGLCWMERATMDWRHVVLFKIGLTALTDEAFQLRRRAYGKYAFGDGSFSSLLMSNLLSIVRHYVLRRPDDSTYINGGNKL